MSKQDWIIVGLLFAALIAWSVFQARQAPPRQAGPPGGAPSAAATGAVERAAGLPDETALMPERTNAVRTAVTETARPEADAAARPETPETRVTLSNAQARVTLSSWGGGIVRAQLSRYRAALDEDSGPVELDFDGLPALSLSDVPGLGTNAAFEITQTGTGAVRVVRRTDYGLHFERQVRAADGYVLDVSDTFVNDGHAPLALPAHGVRVGAMEMIRSNARTRGLSYLGIDTLPAVGGEGVRFWGKELPGLFGYKTGPLSCLARQNLAAVPESIRRRAEQPTDWAAVKNKFFVQILAPEREAADVELWAGRNPETPGFEVDRVSATLRFGERVLKPGESFTRTMRYYVGPKKYSRLKHLGNHQGEVMQFGWLKWLCKKLLWLLNAIHGILPNYGMAIIILTVIVRAVFWPVTHKSTESMKKMQAIQPQVQDIRKKYKDKPQKMNQEIMALYKANKVNPMAGCLPILVQIPVFIALFTVLRSAIELRFAEFLWIRDLSEPERLFADMLPIPLNILPLFMTATMIWQQRLTPTAGDPQQQKMMMLMPVVFLFIFYPMASGLVLYWSVSQLLAILQLLIQRRRRPA
ncbi:MAG: membrane protein insertase YidC [Lentisphaerae bacterium]|nr:membrane protein insertase YidC [Lentisphaerota bacterium]